MFSSLRSRLWLSYAFLIVTAMSMVAVILFFSLLRSPAFYRQTIEQLKAVQQIVVQPGQDSSALFNSARNASARSGVRLLLFSKNHVLLWDTNATDTPLAFPVKRILFNKLPLARDAKGAAWLYSSQKLADGNILMVAAPRPRFSIWNLFTDDLIPIFLQSGLIALILSLFLAFLFSRWLADPLQRMIAAARVMPSVEAQPVEVQGPHEVQELTRAFNAMILRTQASQRSQRDFVANVSHELKTPLTSIQGFSQAILDGTAGTDEKRKQAAQVIHDESGRMHRLVLDLLDLAKLDSGTADMKMIPLQINALLKAVVEKFAPQSTAAGVTITTSLEADLPNLPADGDRLAQVFTNLVDNALKFTPAGGSIKIQSSRIKEAIRVTVADNGAGMPPELAAHIFERFHQGEASRSRQGRHGAGLGLAIAREIVQAHGGRIDVRSTPGEGTVFEVFLPLTKR